MGLAFPTMCPSEDVFGRKSLVGWDRPSGALGLYAIVFSLPKIYCNRSKVQFGIKLSGPWW